MQTSLWNINKLSFIDDSKERLHLYKNHFQLSTHSISNSKIKEKSLTCEAYCVSLTKIYGNKTEKLRAKNFIKKLQGTKCKRKRQRDNQYHLVRDVIKKPRKTVSSRSGAKTPVMPTKQAVLQ